MSNEATITILPTKFMKIATAEGTIYRAHAERDGDCIVWRCFPQFNSASRWESSFIVRTEDAARRWFILQLAALGVSFD